MFQVNNNKLKPMTPQSEEEYMDQMNEEAFSHSEQESIAAQAQYEQDQANDTPMKTPTPEEVLNRSSMVILDNNLRESILKAMRDYAEAYHKAELEKFTKKNKI